MSTEKFYVIKGIKEGHGPSGEIPLRREVDEWYEDPKNKDQVNLFFLALQEFQSIPVTERDSYYQIAGIHGQPLVPWDENDQQSHKGQFGGAGGYCAHRTVLFPTWHRPYVLLFEQRLHDLMIQKIIPKFPESERAGLIQAANVWRLPYWDFAAKKLRKGSKVADYDLPLIAVPKTITVLRPDGKTSTIPNPMRAFKIEASMADPMKQNNLEPGKQDPKLKALGLTGGLRPFHHSLSTSRQVPRATITKALARLKASGDLENDKDLYEGIQDNDSSRDSVRGGNHDWLVSKMFGEDFFSSYGSFATKKYEAGETDPDKYLSCEFVHDQIHGQVGGYGHMGFQGIAAFDPIFWLHHCNVDRMIAMWQALNPEAWFDDPSEIHTDELGTFAIGPKQRLTPETPLAPFHRTETADESDSKLRHYLNSNDVRHWTELGYSYPELQPWLPKWGPDGALSKAYADYIRSRIIDLYTPIAEAADFEKLKIPSSAKQSLMASIASFAAQAAPAQEDESFDILDYVVNISYEKFASEGRPFFIEVSIGDQFVGQVFNFSSPATATGGEDGCANCHAQESQRALAAGQVSLTSALLKEHTDTLPSLQPNDVAAFLKDSLRITVAGMTAPTEESVCSKIDASVSVGTAIYFTDNRRLPMFTNYNDLLKVEADKISNA